LAAESLTLLGDEAFELASLVVHYLQDPDPDVAFRIREPITPFAERAHDRPTPAAAPMIEALRASGLEFVGPLWVAVRSILAPKPHRVE
jgi:hypothetical protein